MPPGWSKAKGWQLFEFGGRHLLVRTDPGDPKPLVLLGRRKWPNYRLSLLARKTGGPGGLCVLFEVQDTHNYVRWRLGVNGNRQHVLESVGGGLPRAIAPPVPGTIETGRCYRIEISLRKGVLQCSLDGRLIHHVRGGRFAWAGIGLGPTWSTAEYFDLGVYGPKNVPLFLLDNPAKLKLDTIASDWEPMHSEGCKVGSTWDRLYPFNGYFSQCIRVRAYEKGEGGLRQRGIPVEAGETYRGRLHLRGSGRANLTVSLRGQDGTVYAAQKLGPPNGIWEGRDFTLKPTRSDPKADLCITLDGVANVWLDQVSLVPERLATRWALRADVVETLRGLKPRFLCWPAGPSASHYNWEWGVGPRDNRPAQPVTGGARALFEPACNDFGTDEFLGLCRELGAEPVLVVNPRLGILHVLNWLGYCNNDASTPLGKRRAENGHPQPYGVKHWLVARETGRESGAQSYPLTVAELAREMRGFRPDPQLVVHGEPALAELPADVRHARQAGPMVKRVAKHFAALLAGDDLRAACGELAKGAERLRSAGLGLAALDCPWDAPPLPLAALLVALQRHAPPGSMAGLAFAARPAGDGPALWALLRSHDVERPLPVATQAPGSAEGLVLAAAGRTRGEIVVRLVSLAPRDTTVEIAFDGLKGRPLAPDAEDLSLRCGRGGRGLAPSLARIAVRDGRLTARISRDRPVHIITVRLEGERAWSSQ